MNIPFMNNNIQNKHDVSDEWCLQTIYSAKQAISIHNWNLQTLVTEKFKVIKGLAMGIFSSILHSVKYARRRVIAQKMKFSIKDFFSKCDQIDRILRIWSQLLKKSLVENFIFYALVCLVRLPSSIWLNGCVLLYKLNLTGWDHVTAWNYNANRNNM